MFLQKGNIKIIDFFSRYRIIIFTDLIWYEIELFRFPTESENSLPTRFIHKLWFFSLILDIIMKLTRFFMPKHWIYALGNLGLCILVMHFKWIKIGKFASGMATHRWTFNPIYANACTYILYLMNIYTPNPYKYISTFNIKNNTSIVLSAIWIY